jgi:chitinase
MYCRKNYQAACCETDTVSMELFGKCHWGPAPNCGPSCSSDETYLAWSGTGSGGAICNNQKGTGSFFDRSYCCGEQEEDSRWEDCQLYDNIGIGPAGGKDFCRTGCPSDRVRVAMDGWGGVCKQGALTTCCTPKSQTVTKELTLEDTRFTAALDMFLGNRDGYCSDDLGSSKEHIIRFLSQQSC